MLIKVCGMKYPENIKELSSLKIDLMGFIFYEGSKRYTEKVPFEIPENIKTAGVFVNRELRSLIETAEINKLDYVQLHGDEDLQYCLKIKETGIKMIKVFRVDDDFDFNIVSSYEAVADFFLFDTKTKLYGGSGMKFNWAKLKEYRGNVPFLLSGGIKHEDHDCVKNFRHSMLAGVDLNSGFETEPGMKDFKKIKIFINNI